MDRRGFFKCVGGAGAAAGVTLGVGGLFGGRRARASAWGDFPSVVTADAQLAEDKVAKNVLEVFLYGGLCPWETFYVVPEYGTAGDADYPNEQYWTFQDGGDGIASIAAGCTGMAEDELLEPFAVDELGQQVYLGPFIGALRARADVKERLRVLVQRHELEPHEAAIPLAMSGRFLGNPKLSGLGAAVSHYFNVRSPVAVPAPFSYVLYPTGVFPTDNLRAASAVGALPASSRPVAVKLEGNSTLGATLARETVGAWRDPHDALAAFYADRYRGRYSRPGAAEAMRSATFSDYTFSLGMLQTTEHLAQILNEDLLASIPGSACGDSSGIATPHMGLKIAADLLTREVDAPRYVCVVDGGLIPASGGGGYDTHSGHNRDSARNLHHTLSHLMDIINAPGEEDPGKLNLDETLIILNTEFGRTPYPQGGDGRNHHPYGYVQVMFGGPVGPEQQGLVGAIGPDGIATSFVSPAESRAAALLAMGIWPFENEAWAVGDVRAASTEEEGAVWLKHVVLGHVT